MQTQHSEELGTAVILLTILAGIIESQPFIDFFRTAAIFFPIFLTTSFYVTKHIAQLSQPREQMWITNFVTVFFTCVILLRVVSATFEALGFRFRMQRSGAFAVSCPGYLSTYSHA
jgi:hypothetical protein